MLINIYGYKALRTADFHARDTVCFSYEKNAIDLDAFMQYRSAFPSSHEKNINLFKLPFDNSAIGGSDLDLIITDSPTDVWGLLSFDWLRKELDIDELISDAHAIGHNLDSWSSLRSVSRAIKGRIVAPAIARLAGAKRLTPAQFLGGIVLSWEQAADQYFFVETKNSSNNVILLPREQRKSFTFREDNPLRGKTPVGLLIIDEHRRPGENLVWVDSTRRNMTEDLTNQSAQALYLPTDIAGISTAIRAKELNHYAIYGDTPSLFFGSAISPLYKSLPPVVYTKPAANLRHSGEYLSEELTSIARDLGVRGYSGKTKAEIVMLLGEHIASQPPIEQRGLLFQDMHGGWRPIENIIEDLAQRNAMTIYDTAEQQFSIAMRIIGRSAYVPTAAPSPAGRLNTDGKFPYLIGYEPLDVLGIEA
jgi:hypothetical protein